MLSYLSLGAHRGRGGSLALPRQLCCFCLWPSAWFPDRLSSSYCRWLGAGVRPGSWLWLERKTEEIQRYVSESWEEAGRKMEEETRRRKILSPKEKMATFCKWPIVLTAIIRKLQEVVKRMGFGVKPSGFKSGFPAHCWVILDRLPKHSDSLAMKWGSSSTHCLELGGLHKMMYLNNLE